MSRKVIVRGANESIEATLPREVLEESGIRDGASLYVVQTDAGVLLTPLDPELTESLNAFELLTSKYSTAMHALAKQDTLSDAELAAAMEVYERGSTRYRNALRKLAG